MIIIGCFSTVLRLHEIIYIDGTFQWDSKVHCIMFKSTEFDEVIEKVSEGGREIVHEISDFLNHFCMFYAEFKSCQELFSAQNS